MAIATALQQGPKRNQTSCDSRLRSFPEELDEVAGVVANDEVASDIGLGRIRPKRDGDIAGLQLGDGALQVIDDQPGFDYAMGEEGVAAEVGCAVLLE